MTNEKTPRPDQTAMAEALGGAAMIGDSIELEDTNKKAFGFDPADEDAKIKAEKYDAAHPIVPTEQIAAPALTSVVDILKSDGVDDLPIKVDQEAPSIVIASAQRRHPEVTSKTEPAFEEMWIDGIMKRVPRN